MNVNAKRCLSLALSVIAVISMLVIVPAYAATDTDAAAILYARINQARTGVSKTEFARNDGLDKIAVAYAEILCAAGADFRKTTDFKSLPNGERVISLAAANNVKVTGFSYSVYYNKNYKFEDSAEFKKKVIDGDFTRVGMACVSGADGSYAVVVIYDKTPIS